MTKPPNNDNPNEWRGKLTPTNRWYRDPKNPLFLSSDAHDERIKRNKAAAKSKETRQFNAQSKSEVINNLGAEAATEIVFRVQCLVSGYDYGIDQPRHANYKGIEFPTKLRRSDIYNHLTNKRTLYYTTKPFLIGNMKIVVVTIDIDNPKHVSNFKSDSALRASKKIIRDMKKIGASVMCQPSTNSNGYHLTFCISFPSNSYDPTIRDHLAALRTAIASKYKSCKCAEVCLKGINFSSSATNGTVYGTLVRLPLICNLAQSKEFFAMTNSPVAFSSLSDFYSLPLQDQDKDQEKTIKSSSHSSAKNTDSASSKSKTHPPLLVEEEKTGTMLISWEDKSAFVSNKAGKKKHEWKENDPLSRMLKAASHYCHTHKRLPTATELLNHYESLNLNTGAIKSERRKRAKKALEWVTANHNFTPPSEISLYSKWLKHFQAKNYSKADLTYSGTRTIKTEHLALVMAIIEHKELIGHERGLAKNCFVTISRAKKARGEIGFVLDDKKFAFCRSFLIDTNVIEIVDGPRKSEATKYRLAR